MLEFCTVHSIGMNMLELHVPPNVSPHIKQVCYTCSTYQLHLSEETRTNVILFCANVRPFLKPCPIQTAI